MRNYLPLISCGPFPNLLGFVLSQASLDKISAIQFERDNRPRPHRRPDPGYNKKQEALPVLEASAK
jgi:hypothetical protein